MMLANVSQYSGNETDLQSCHEFDLDGFVFMAPHWSIIECGAGGLERDLFSGGISEENQR